MAGIKGLFGFFLGWVGSASPPPDIPTHTLAMTIYGPKRTLDVESARHSVEVLSCRRTYDE